MQMLPLLAEERAQQALFLMQRFQESPSRNYLLPTPRSDGHQRFLYGKCSTDTYRSKASENGDQDSAGRLSKRIDLNHAARFSMGRSFSLSPLVEYRNRLVSCDLEHNLGSLFWESRPRPQNEAQCFSLGPLHF